MPRRLVLLRAPNEREILWAMEEGLRSRALAAVVGEVEALSTSASRRLQLAAESTGVTGFVLHRNAGHAAASAAVTRWRVAAMPSAPVAGEPGIGQPRWRVELLRCRGGMPAAWEVEACDDDGVLCRCFCRAGRSTGASTDWTRGRSARPDRPFVLATTAGGRRVITAVSAAAAMEGIAPGMGVADARALDPALLIEEADFIADAAALAKLAAMVRPLQPLGHVLRHGWHLARRHRLRASLRR